MTCPKCGAEKPATVCTIKDCESVQRKKRCRSCGHTFYTEERESDGEEFRRISAEIDFENYRRKVLQYEH